MKKKSRSGAGSTERPARESLTDVDSAASPSMPPELAPTAKAASKDPANEELWDELEAKAAELQTPDPIAALYRKVLGRDLGTDLTLRIAERALRFHDEWFSESEPLIDVLQRMLEADPTSDVAFERLTLVFTGAERWEDLLALYDRLLASTQDKSRRIRLLDEAAHTAKDFAGQPDRAITYMQQLFELKPTDGQLATSLERLFERQSRFNDLIQLWTTRVTVLPKDAAQATRARIAACHLDQLDDPRSAQDVAAQLVGDPVQDAAACALLERIVARDGTPADVRDKAVDALRSRYESTGKIAEIARVLAAALTFAEGAPRAALHRDIAERLVSLGRESDAVDHFAAVLAIEPHDATSRARLESLAEQTHRQDRLADALVTAADAATESGLRVDLLVRAGDIRCDLLSDEPAAIALFARVLGTSDVSDDVALGVARKQAVLLERAAREAELLDVFERLAVLESDPTAVREALGRAGRLARKLGDVDRSLRSWRTRISADRADLEALDEVVDILDVAGRWEDLIAALNQRVAVVAAPERKRADLVRVAAVQASRLERLDAAIDTWRGISHEFGTSAESVDALADLLARAGRWDEFSDMLERAVGSETDVSRRAELLAHRGDAHRLHLSQPDRAVESYDAALGQDPRNGRAREGLRALVSDPAVGRSAVERLAAAFSSTDEWSHTLGVLEDRLRWAPDDATRIQLLLSAANIHEQRAGDAAAAVGCVGRAFPLAWNQPAVEAELERLADASGSWNVAVRAFGDAIEAAATPDDRSRLWFRRGTIFEEKLGDLASALDAFRQVNALDPGRVDATLASVRTGARSGRWQVVADALVESARARAAVPTDVVAVLETIATETDAWAIAAEVLGSTIASADGLTDHVARELEAQAAFWHRDRRHDPDAAEAALLRAVDHEGTHAPTLTMLAELQRRSPGRPLVTTLLGLARTLTEDLAALHEAADIALDRLGDDALAQPILEALLERATAAWHASGAGDAANAGEQEVTWALERLVGIHERRSNFAHAIDLLVKCSRLPYSGERSRGYRHRAAELAWRKTHDATRAVDLYREILGEAPADATAIAQLGEIYAAEGRLSDLLEIRGHELGLSPPLERRLEIRLDMSRVNGELGQADARVANLRENLAEQPGHARSISEISSVLESLERYGDLADVLSEQATRLEQAARGLSAAPLWARVAEIAEVRLGDSPRAIGAWRKVVQLDPSARAFDALARIHSERAEHAAAVGWLEQRLEISPSDERAEVVVRLARAYLGSSQLDRALTLLERENADDPRSESVRDLLADQYRRIGRWSSLADLLAAGADYVEADEARLEMLREAADIHISQLDAPDAAIPLLDRALGLAPDDRTLQTTMADALRAAGRLDDAQAILDRLIAAFGRRRPPERAGVHYQLARIARMRGDLESALSQLDTAAGIDMGRADILRMLGDVAREAGQLERSERAYRKLLLVVRRHSPEFDDPRAVTASEVLLDLYRLALQLSQEDRAAEVLESAFETAGQNRIEAVRLERALRADGKTELLLRALQARMPTVSDDAEGATVLGEISTILADQLGRVDEAFDVCLDALSRRPDSDGLHDATRKLAVRTQRIERYGDVLAGLVDRARSSNDAKLACRLLLRLGALCFEDLGRNDRAAAHFAEAEQLGAGGADVWRSLERVYGGLGDRDGQLRVLGQIVNAGADEVSDAERTDALYRLAGLQLALQDSRAAGVDTLTWAVDRDPRYDVALELLGRAGAAAPDDDAVIGLYERVARASGDDAQLLAALEYRSKRPDVSMDLLREAVEIAARLESAAREELLLRRAVAFAKESGVGADGVWAMVALAERRKTAADLTEAMQFLREAAEFSDASDSSKYLLEAAAIAAGPANDLELASTLYEQLRERDPGERDVWAPLLEVTRRRGDDARLDAIISATLEHVFDRDERNELRMERARLLLKSKRNDDATSVLRDVLDEDPDHTAAAATLADVYERTGQNEQLAEHLGRQFDSATERSDGAAAAQFARRLGGLLGVDRREEVIAIYQRALQAGANDKDLLRALLGLYGPDDDASARAEAMERLLSVESGDPAALLALDLVAVRESLGDEPAVERALSLGFERAPANDTIRQRLEQWYSDREDFTRLAQVIEGDAANRTDPVQKVARLRQAAALYTDRLGDPGAAARVLAQARAVLPEDLELLAEYIRALSASGETHAAVEQLATVISGATFDEPTQAGLLALRAELSTSLGDDAAAVTDLEQAFALGGATYGRDLSEALGRLRLTAMQAGDTESERSTTMRLVEVLLASGDASRACDVLAEWVDRDPQDGAALQSLADMSAAAERWDLAAAALARIALATEGQARTDSAIAATDAWERAGTPELARETLEAVYQADATNETLRARLRTLYETIGAWHEFVQFMIEDAANASDDATRHDRLRKAGEVLLHMAQDAAAAIEPLESAMRLKPSDHVTLVLLADAYTASGDPMRSRELLEPPINAMRGRRTRELASLQHRMAHVAHALGDAEAHLAWLDAALDCDMQNGPVASELAELAFEVAKFDTALKALRALTLMKSPMPMSRATAYLRQGMILQRQGDAKRAVHMAKKALQEDSALEEAHDFLRQLGAE